jgi:hypothetical protein
MVTLAVRMTRMLSDLLGAQQPGFAQRIKQLELASGEPGTEIRLSTAIMQRTAAKIRDLGLDPHDTSGPELYRALQLRLLADEQRLRAYMHVDEDASPITVLGAVIQFEKKLQVPRSSFALKTSLAKRLLKNVPPKKAMVKLGYRSVDSMIKHEPIANIYAAGLTYEASHWHQAFLNQYDSVHPGDFESRDVSVQFPSATRWEGIAKQFAAEYRHTSVVFKELGSIVVLPVHTAVPALAITTLLSLLDGLNTIRCASTYLKLHQVGANFGSVVHQINKGEPMTVASLAGQPLPWRVVQYYYHLVHEAYHPALFEPHVQPEDLALVEAEAALAEAIPALEFWQDTAGLAHVDNGQVVSLNMLDVALGAANGLAFENRIVKNVRRQVWSDVIIRYLRNKGFDYLLEQLSTSEQESARLEPGVFA